MNLSLPLLRAILFSYSALMLVGGAMGASKSIASLVAGVVCGGLALAGGIIAQGNAKVGLTLALCGAGMAIGGMLPRYLKSHAVWPAGAVTAASILVAIAMVLALVATVKGSR